jgi:hypothetical protein
MNKELEELMLICDIESDDAKVGWRKRRDAMNEWIGKYVYSVETELSVVNPEVFDTEFMDFIKESLAKSLAEDLTSYTNYDILDKKIKARMTVLDLNKRKQDGKE